MLLDTGKKIFVLGQERICYFGVFLHHWYSLCVTSSFSLMRLGELCYVAEIKHEENLQ